MAHTEKDELYVAIYSLRDHDVIMFYEEGGVEIGDVDAKVRKIWKNYGTLQLRWPNYW